YESQQAIESGEQIIVGLNRFTNDEETPIDLLRVDPAIEAAQRERLARLRETRDNAKVAEPRARLETAAEGREKRTPVVLTCGENDVTLGEICHTLRGVFGEYRPDATI